MGIALGTAGGAAAETAYAVILDDRLDRHVPGAYQSLELEEVILYAAQCAGGRA